MGSIWLGSLPDVLRSAGVPVDVYPGWETRSRSTGGYDQVLAVQVHHTASNTTPRNDMAYMWLNAPARPIGALHLARDGRWTVGAAGATNTSGLGGPLYTTRGTIPKDAANRYVISVEAANRGDGEVWPDAQLRSYVKGVAALTKAYVGAVNVPGDVHSHFEWAPGRKNDPAGNSWYATGRNMWNMGQFRNDVRAAIAPAPPIDPLPQPDLGDDDMSTKTILIDLHHPTYPYGVWYLCDAVSKTWVQDGNMAEQLKYRVMEATGKPVDYSKPAADLPSALTLSSGVAIDGHRYSVVRNGNVHLVASFGPIVGPRPAGVDEYGR